MRKTVVAVLMTLCLGCLGCGKGDGLDRAAVEGKVTLDGAPVQEGSITFFPTGGTEGPSAGGPIENGRYSLSGAEGPVVGRHRVEIHAPRPTGEKVPHPFDPEKMVEKVAEGAPKQYNTESTLEEELKAGKNVVDFELTSE